MALSRFTPLMDSMSYKLQNIKGQNWKININDFNHLLMTFNIKISHTFSAEAGWDKFNNATIRFGQYGATAAIKHLAAPSLYY